MRAVATRTTGKRVVHTITRWWDVPHCSRCVAHIQRYRVANSLLKVGAVLGLSVWFFGWISSGSGWLWAIGGAGVLMGLVVLSGRMKQSARAMTQPSCTAVGRAVEYLRWYSNFHEFIFSSQPYLNAFLSSNGGKQRSDVRQVD